MPKQPTLPSGSGTASSLENTPESAITRRGLMLVISSPSGAGKTTLSRALLASDGRITMSVSVTTRAPRPGEIDGKDYYFIDKTRFESLRDQGQLLEWAEVFDNYYGTLKDEVEASLAAGRDILFDIDWQGTQQLTEKMAADLVRVFILPPSGPTLAGRLASRAQDSAETVARRMAAAANEISHWAEYDYVIVNDELAPAIQNLQAILAAERLKRSRQTGLSDFVRRILASLES